MNDSPGYVPQGPSTGDVTPAAGSASSRIILAQFLTARDFAVASLPGFLLAIIGAIVGKGPGLVMIILGIVLAGMMLFCATIILSLALKWRRHADELLAGQRLAHWRYPPDQWREHLTKQHKASVKLPWIFAGLGLLMGLVMAALLTDDNHHIAGIPALTWTLWPLAGLVVGLVPGLIIRWRMRAGVDRMAQHPGEVIIGFHGFYMPGTYTPWNTLGQTLRQIRHVPGPPDALAVTVEVFTGQTTVARDFEIPVPPGCEEEAARIARLLGDEDQA